MSNKRYLILAMLLLGWSYSAQPQSEILDGGEIVFNGFVTDEAPKWTWQVASPGQTWAVDTADARVENGELVFDLRDKGTLPFLEGHLHEVAERGGPGFTPFITFSSSGEGFALSEGSSTTAQLFRATVPVHSPQSHHPVGQLAFTLEQGMGVASGMQEEGASLPGGMSLISGESVSNVQADRLSPGLQSRLSNLLMMNNGFGQSMSATGNGLVIGQGVLGEGRIMQLAAAYASTVSNFELRLSAANTPSEWQAGLNVTVTVQ